jgi:hypothetical protein
MPDTAPGHRGRDRQKIPRIEAKEAEQVYTRCDHLEESAGDPLGTLQNTGFDKFLSQMEEQILQLAVQPDSWGERTRARLISHIFADLRGRPVETVGAEEIARVSNLVVPCFLLELGRRKQHIEIEFPENPCDSGARFEFRAGRSRPRYSIDSEQLLRLVAKAGEELVGLCYFGDQPSREHIEAHLAFKGSSTDS